MKNNKGFSLVELLAMLVVLAILMGIAIPNISGMLKNQRLNIIKSDASKMVDTTKIKVSKNKIVKPGNNECLVFSLDYLNDNDNITTGPNGGKYSEYDSFVLYTRKGSRYKYYVRLIEKVKENEYSGFDLVDIDEIKETENNNIQKVTTEYNLSEDKATSKVNLDANSRIRSICSSVRDYYVNSKHICAKYKNGYFDKDGNLTTQSACEESCGAPCE